MERKYHIDLKDLSDKKREEADAAFIDALLEYLKRADPVDWGNYEKDSTRRELFELTIEMVLRAFEDVDCEISSKITQHGFVGTIAVRCRGFSPSDPELFKAAVLSADSLEMEGNLDGIIEINLTFFNMMKKVRDRSKN